MKITNNDTIILNDVIKGLLQNNPKMPINTFYMFTQNKAELETPVKTLGEVGKSLETKYPENTDEQKEAKSKEWQGLMEKEIDVNFHMIDWEEFKKDMPVIDTHFYSADKQVRYTDIIFKYIINMKPKNK